VSLSDVTNGRTDRQNHDNITTFVYNASRGKKSESAIYKRSIESSALVKKVSKSGQHCACPPPIDIRLVRAANPSS